MAAFTVMITALSVILTYFTFKSKRMWQAILFRAAHNVYIDKIFDPLTIKGENTVLWAGEDGLMIPITTSMVALYFWRKAKAEGM